MSYMTSNQADFRFAYLVAFALSRLDAFITRVKRIADSLKEECNNQDMTDN